MGTTFIKPTFFDKDGHSTGSAPNTYCPPYMDWMPIELKAYWFLNRGYGEPEATHVLLQSQGEQLLVPITTPLQRLDFRTLQEIDNGLEDKCSEYAREAGISRVPRNQ